MALHIHYRASRVPRGGFLKSKKPRQLPRIRIVHRKSALAAVPLARGTRATNAVALPKLPLSLVYWMTGLGQLFWIEHRRCIGLLLMLDLEYRRWTCLIPTQNCTPQAVQWKTTSEDLVDQPSHLFIAGSFQTTSISGMYDAHALVPAFDGLHLIQQVDREDGGAWSFIHSDGEPALADPSSVLGDDLSDTLRRYTHRLKLA